MIFKILVYFFLIFGISEFILLIWQIITLTNTRNSNVFIVVPEKELQKRLYELTSILKGFPFRIYILSEERIEKEAFYNKHFQNIHIVNTQQLTEEIQKNYGSNYR